MASAAVSTPPDVHIPFPSRPPTYAEILRDASSSAILPDNTTISHISRELRPTYKRLLTSIFPIRYPDKFYSDAVEDPRTSHTIALCVVKHPTPASQHPTSLGGLQVSTVVELELSKQPQVIAGIQARIELAPNFGASGSPQEYHLYLQTLCTAAPYRRLNLASTLLAILLSATLKIHSGKIIKTVYVHVWEANEDAMDWYGRRGFVTEGPMVKHYYRNLRPSGAWVLRTRVGIKDWLKVTKVERLADRKSAEAIHADAVKGKAEAIAAKEPENGQNGGQEEVIHGLNRVTAVETTRPAADGEQQTREVRETRNCHGRDCSCCTIS